VARRGYAGACPWPSLATPGPSLVAIANSGRLHRRPRLAARQRSRFTGGKESSGACAMEGVGHSNATGGFWERRVRAEAAVLML
jgi:hypothetical protein